MTKSIEERLAALEKTVATLAGVTHDAEKVLDSEYPKAVTKMVGEKSHTRVVHSKKEEGDFLAQNHGPDVKAVPAALGAAVKNSQKDG